MESLSQPRYPLPQTREVQQLLGLDLLEQNKSREIFILIKQALTQTHTFLILLYIGQVRWTCNWFWDFKRTSNMFWDLGSPQFGLQVPRVPIQFI